MSLNPFKLLAVFVILFLLVGAAFLGVKKYIEVQRELQIIKEISKTQKINENILGFTKLFIDEVLRAEQEIDFGTRLKLENAVRNIDDEEVVAQWQKFVESKTEAQAQKEVKNLLDLLVGKIQVQ